MASVKHFFPTRMPIFPFMVDRGHIVFGLSVIDLNLHHNFGIRRDKDLIFGMHAPLSNDAKVNDIVAFTVTLITKTAFLGFVSAVGIVFHKQKTIYVGMK